MIKMRAFDAIGNVKAGEMEKLKVEEDQITAVNSRFTSV